ncbi:hypothetical protein F7725_015195, partial [Dissostichus mawsoni]
MVRTLSSTTSRFSGVTTFDSTPVVPLLTGANPMPAGCQVQVVFGQGAERADLRQTEQQVSEASNQDEQLLHQILSSLDQTGQSETGMRGNKERQKDLLSGDQQQAVLSALQHVPADGVQQQQIAPAAVQQLHLVIHLGAGENHLINEILSSYLSYIQ